MVGPPSLNDLCAILLRFHLHNYTLFTDVEKAFLHVCNKVSISLYITQQPSLNTSAWEYQSAVLDYNYHTARLSGSTTG